MFNVQLLESFFVHVSCEFCKQRDSRELNRRADIHTNWISFVWLFENGIFSVTFQEHRPKFLIVIEYRIIWFIMIKTGVFGITIFETYRNSSIQVLYYKNNS